jgi:hypothetical protein
MREWFKKGQGDHDARNARNARDYPVRDKSNDPPPERTNGVVRRKPGGN